MIEVELKSISYYISHYSLYEDSYMMLKNLSNYLGKNKPFANIFLACTTLICAWE